MDNRVDMVFRINRCYNNKENLEKRGVTMARVISVGNQDFASIREKNCFYIDKTAFIKEWWESEDTVTLITRPRRFGKTLNMSMMDYFWSNQYENKKVLFDGLDIWKDSKYRELQGSYPVIFLSFAGIKGKNYEQEREQICLLLEEIYQKNVFLLDSNLLTQSEKSFFHQVNITMSDAVASMALKRLSDFLSRYYGKKVLIFLDEYDTPMQEAYINGFWDEMVSFTRNLFNNTFKTNPYLERAILTGVTRADIVAPSSLGSKEPCQVSEVGFPTRLEKTSPSIQCQFIFSDLNNLKVVTMASNEYATYFGFTEDEVFSVLDEYGISEKENVKRWYDGFTIGKQKDMYNPWSIIQLLDTKKCDTYWANTSSNGLVGKLLREGSKEIKLQFAELIKGNSIKVRLETELVFQQLSKSERAIWGLLLSSGYVKIVGRDKRLTEIMLTNYETAQMFEDMVSDWFEEKETDYNDFIKALLKGNVKEMNAYMNRITESMFSYFDVGNKPSEKVEPERFYHGFVLGLLVELEDRYIITSNRESGFGRYDVLLEPKDTSLDGIILEFKVIDPEEEASLKETVQAALKQIAEKNYAQTLIEHGISKTQIRSYGFAFEGKKVLIGDK